MLKDYARYIENIRNSLMQCGVIFPQIDDIDNADYGVLFHIGEKLNDVMYFYKIMVCSGNMEEMFLPLDKSYRGTVRMEAFTEFKEDILPALKEMFGDEDEDDNFNFGVLLDIDGAVDSEDEPEVWVNDSVGVEDTLFEAEDLFGDDDEDGALSFEPVDVAKQFVASGASLWGTSSEDATEYVSHGTSLFSKKAESSIQESITWVNSGTELFSISVSSTVATSNEDEDVWVDDSDDADFDDNASSSDGDMFADDDEDVWVEDSDEDVFEDAPEGGLWESGDDEDVWVEDSEDYESGEDVFTDDDEDVWVPDEDDSGDVVEDVEDVWADEPEDNIWEESEDDIWEEPDELATETLPAPVSNVVPKASAPVRPRNQPVTVPDEDRDIVDTVQEAASAALTSAKRFLTKLTKP